MTQISLKLKYPLEKTQEAFRIRLKILMVFAVMMQSRVIRAWAVLCGTEKAHHGGGLLLPNEDSLRFQWRVARALGGTDRALLVQKFEEWIEHNKSEGRPATTYNGYKDWVAAHFGHLSAATLGRQVRALETMGVLMTRRVGGSDQRKAYRIDYRRLNTLIAGVNVGHSKTQTANSNSEMAATSLNTRDSSLNNDSNKRTKTESQEPQTKPGRGGRRAGAGRKEKAKSTLNSTPTPTAAEPHSVQAGMSATHDQDRSPSSETPPSQPDTKLIERMAALGLDSDKASGLIDHYSADRVRAVVRKCELRRRPDARESRIEKPDGWVVAELKNDVFKLGVLSEADELALNARRDPSIVAWGAQIKRDMEQMIAEDTAHVTEKAIEPSGTGLDTQVAARMTAREVWRTARQQLSVQDQQFKSWLADARLRDYAYIDGVGTYTVAVTLENARTQMQQRYYRGIESVFKGLQNAPVRIEFEVGT